ncbi:uncharacterized protein LOC144918092 isoform X2 [Branchiostoma floridae x Branchiostoma belcheri]
MDALLSTFFLSILLLATPVSGECRISGYIEFNGVCYKDFAVASTYVEAVQRCAEDGAMLAMPRDNETNAFIHGLMTGYARWIGLTDSANEGEWVFQDGGTLASAGYSNWNPGEPNNAANDPNVEEDCARMRQVNSKWNDAVCSTTAPGFVCQLDATQQTTQVPTTTGPRYTTDQTTQRTTLPGTTTSRTTQRPTLPGTTGSQYTTSHTTQRSTLPEATGSQYTTSHTTQRSTLPEATGSQYTTNHMAQRSTLPGTTVISHQTTNQTTGQEGGESAKSIGSWYNKPLNLALVCVGCAAGIIGVGGVLMYYYGNRRQRRRQVAQDPQD